MEGFKKNSLTQCFFSCFFEKQQFIIQIFITLDLYIGINILA